jgi:hypothetical protein
MMGYFSYTGPLRKELKLSIFGSEQCLYRNHAMVFRKITRYKKQQLDLRKNLINIDLPKPIQCFFVLS